MREEGSEAARRGPAPASVGATKTSSLSTRSGFEERGRERRASLEQERLDALGRERPQLVLERAGAQLELEPAGQRPPREDEPPRLAARRRHVARVEPRPVGSRRPTADRDRVDLRPQLVHEAAALLARSPSARPAP